MVMSYLARQAALKDSGKKVHQLKNSQTKNIIKRVFETIFCNQLYSLIY